MCSPVRVLGFAVALCAIGAASPGSALPSSWRVSGQIGGPTTAVAIAGGTAFVGVGRRVLVYDVNDPAAPRRIGESDPFPDEVTDVVVDPELLYVSAGSAGLRILEMIEPEHPREIGAWDSPGSAEGLAVRGTVVYLADGPFGLRAVDVSDPSHPAPLGSAFVTRFAYSVALSGDLALIASAGSGLSVAGIRDPSCLEELATLETEGFARDVTVDGTNVYLAAQWGGIRVISIANPARPLEIASLALPGWAFGVASLRATLFVADGSQGLLTVDVSDPGAPRITGRYPIRWQHAGRVTVAGDRAYVATRGEGIHIVDARDPLSPARLGTATQLAEARASAVLSSIAYVAAADQGVRILDLDSGGREIGTLSSGGFAYCAATMSPGTLIIGSTGIGTPGLHFFDITRSRDPRPVSVLAGEGINPTDISVEGSLVAISGEPGIHLIDASNPSAPEVLSFLNLTASSPFADLVWDVALSGKTACVAQSAAGMRLVDITNPRAPRIAGTYKPETLMHAQAVAVQGRYAYVAGGPSGLHVVDISEPQSPVTVAVLRPLVGAERMRLEGSTLLIAAGAGGLVTVDVSVPSRPEITSVTHLPGYAFGVTAASRRALVASGEAGLHVLEASAEPGRAFLVSTTLSGGSIPSPELMPAQRFLGSGRVRAPEGSKPSARRSPARLLSGREIVVRQSDDSGPGTLREALANLRPGDRITFDPAAFPPSDPATIKVSEQLPCLCADGVVLDASNAGVVIDGRGAPAGSIGLILAADRNQVRGLSIVNFEFSGIWLTGSRNEIGGDRRRGTGPSGEGNVISGNSFAGILFPDSVATENQIRGNLIGTDVTGTRALGKQNIGVFLFPGGPGNTVGGKEPWEANVISGNALAEVFFQQASGNVISGNLIGTDPAGSRRVGAASMGLGTGAHSSDNVIRGNVIVASGQGIILSDSGSSYNQIVGNRIGVGATGEALLPGDSPVTTGVAVSQSYNRIAGNVISGNSQWGVDFSFWASHDSIVKGNLIGLDPGGTKPVPNGTSTWGGGISSYTLRHGFIGGARAAERNVVSGNLGHGIVMSGPGTGGNFILGNLVGSAATGGTPLPNGMSGVVLGTSDGNFVQGDEIAWSRQSGVFESSALANSLRRNSLHDNARGIEFASDSTVTPATPSIRSLSRTRVTGSACSACRIEVFSDNGGEGRLFEGDVTAADDGSFAFFREIGLLSGPQVTVTATDAAGTTSEFSAPASFPAASGPALLAGSARLCAGESAAVPLSFESGPVPAATLSLEIPLPASLTFTGTRAGRAIAESGKKLTVETMESGLRISVDGPVTAPIPDGVILWVAVSAGAGSVPGARELAVTNARAFGARGESLAMSVVNGVITVLPRAADRAQRVLPSSARAAGVGAFWTTDLSVRNASASPASARLEFLGHTGESRLARTIGLLAGETRTFPDVLQSVFGLESDYGPILISSGSSSIVVEGQTWTEVLDGLGTSGQSVPAIAAADLIGERPRSIVGVAQNPLFRTNLMLANPGTIAAAVKVDLVSPSGSVLGEKRVEMPGASFAQLNVSSSFGVEGVAGASFVLSTESREQAVAAYAAVIDRVTGDPRTLLPSPVAVDREWVLPSSAHAAGSGAFWTTDLFLRNSGLSDLTAEIEFLGHTGKAEENRPVAAVLLPGETLTLLDVLKKLFGRESDWGPIVVRGSSDALVVTSQTSTPGGGGSFGQSVPAVPLEDLIGGLPRSLAGVREDDRFRTNLMLANPGRAATDVQVELRSSSGRLLARRTMSMEPRSFAQLSVAKDLEVTGIQSASLVVKTVTPGGSVAAYTSVIDQATGDPRTLLPR